jgi:fluoroquinolone transport system permease protein
MRKYLGLLKYEFKTILKDKFGFIMLIYPLFMFVIIGFVLPAVVKNTPAVSMALMFVIVLVMALSFESYMAGVLLGFNLIENKDDNTILGIAVTPVSVNNYIIFKTVYIYAFSVAINVLFIGGLKLFVSEAYVIEYGGATISLLGNIGWGHVVVFSFVNSFFAGAVAMLLATFAANKIEGFAYLKAGGIALLLPLLSLLKFFSDGKQYLLGVLPNFWPIKAMLKIMMVSRHPSDLGFYAYMLIGLVYMIGLVLFSFALLRRKLRSAGK